MQECLNKPVAKTTPRRCLELSDTENSEPQGSGREIKLNFSLPSSPPNPKGARYFNVLPKSGSPVYRHYSLCQRVTPARGITSPMSGQGRRERRVAERKPAPATHRVTSVNSSTERTPEIKIGTTPPKTGVSDCRRSLRLGDVISQLGVIDDSDIEFDDDIDGDPLVTAIKEAPIHSSCSTTSVDESVKKDFLQAPQMKLVTENARQGAKVPGAVKAQHCSSESICRTRKRRRVESHDTNTLADDSTPSAAKKLCIDRAVVSTLCPTIVSHKTPPHSTPRRLTRSVARKTAQTPQCHTTVQSSSNDSEDDTDSESDYEPPELPEVAEVPLPSSGP